MQPLAASAIGREPGVCFGTLPTPLGRLWASGKPGRLRVHMADHRKGAGLEGGMAGNEGCRPARLDRDEAASHPRYSLLLHAPIRQKNMSATIMAEKWKRFCTGTMTKGLGLDGSMIDCTSELAREETSEMVARGGEVGRARFKRGQAGAARSTAR